MGSQKGFGFEREVSRKLSMWWSGGTRDDIFWRTSGSGARATNRLRRGRRTANSYGDIMALDPVGEPLLRVATIECKRGYPKQSVTDLLDQLDSRRTPVYVDWISDAWEHSFATNSLGWMLIHRRDQRAMMALMPRVLWEGLGLGNLASRSVPSLMLSSGDDVYLYLQLDHLLKQMSPDQIRGVAAQHAPIT